MVTVLLTHMCGPPGAGSFESPESSAWTATKREYSFLPLVIQAVKIVSAYKMFSVLDVGIFVCTISIGLLHFRYTELLL